ncbi:hypothetical protein ACQY0O_001540 [Thecaphora frezii]
MQSEHLTIDRQHKTLPPTPSIAVTPPREESINSSRARTTLIHLGSAAQDEDTLTLGLETCLQGSLERSRDRCVRLRNDSLTNDHVAEPGATKLSDGSTKAARSLGLLFVPPSHGVGDITEYQDQGTPAISRRSPSPFRGSSPAITKSPSSTRSRSFKVRLKKLQLLSRPLYGSKPQAPLPASSDEGIRQTMTSCSPSRVEDDEKRGWWTSMRAMNKKSFRNLKSGIGVQQVAEEGCAEAKGDVAPPAKRVALLGRQSGVASKSSNPQLVDTSVGSLRRRGTEDNRNSETSKVVPIRPVGPKKRPPIPALCVQEATPSRKAPSETTARRTLLLDAARETPRSLPQGRGLLAMSAKKHPWLRQLVLQPTSAATDSKGSLTDWSSSTSSYQTIEDADDEKAMKSDKQGKAEGKRQDEDGRARLGGSNSSTVSLIEIIGSPPTLSKAKSSVLSHPANKSLPIPPRAKRSRASTLSSQDSFQTEPSGARISGASCSMVLGGSSPHSPRSSCSPHSPHNPHSPRNSSYSVATVATSILYADQTDLLPLHQALRGEGTRASPRKTRQHGSTTYARTSPYSARADDGLTRTLPARRDGARSAQECARTAQEASMARIDSVATGLYRTGEATETLSQLVESFDTTLTPSTLTPNSRAGCSTAVDRRELWIFPQQEGSPAEAIEEMRDASYQPDPRRHSETRSSVALSAVLSYCSTEANSSFGDGEELQDLIEGIMAGSEGSPMRPARGAEEAGSPRPAVASEQRTPPDWWTTFDGETRDDSHSESSLAHSDASETLTRHRRTKTAPGVARASAASVHDPRCSTAASWRCDGVDFEEVAAARTSLTGHPRDFEAASPTSMRSSLTGLSSSVNTSPTPASRIARSEALRAGGLLEAFGLASRPAPLLVAGLESPELLPNRSRRPPPPKFQLNDEPVVIVESPNASPLLVKRTTALPGRQNAAPSKSATTIAFLDDPFVVQENAAIHRCRDGEPRIGIRGRLATEATEERTIQQPRLPNSPNDSSRQLLAVPTHEEPAESSFDGPPSEPSQEVAGAGKLDANNREATDEPSLPGTPESITTDSGFDVVPQYRWDHLLANTKRDLAVSRELFPTTPAVERLMSVFRPPTELDEVGLFLIDSKVLFRPIEEQRPVSWETLMERDCLDTPQRWRQLSGRAIRMLQEDAGALEFTLAPAGSDTGAGHMPLHGAASSPNENTQLGVGECELDESSFQSKHASSLWDEASWQAETTASMTCYDDTAVWRVQKGVRDSSGSSISTSSVTVLGGTPGYLGLKRSACCSRTAGA